MLELQCASCGKITTYNRYDEPDDWFTFTYADGRKTGALCPDHHDYIREKMW